MVEASNTSRQSINAHDVLNACSPQARQTYRQPRWNAEFIKRGQRRFHGPHPDKRVHEKSPQERDCRSWPVGLPTTTPPTRQDKPGAAGVPPAGEQLACKGTGRRCINKQRQDENEGKHRTGLHRAAPGSVRQEARNAEHLGGGDQKAGKAGSPARPHNVTRNADAVGDGLESARVVFRGPWLICQNGLSKASTRVGCSSVDDAPVDEFLPQDTDPPRPCKSLGGSLARGRGGGLTERRLRGRIGDEQIWDSGIPDWSRGQDVDQAGAQVGEVLEKGPGTGREMHLRIGAEVADDDGAKTRKQKE
ncbi:hypothetical protein LY76DRAFT_597617 [Colletotrichum caudatum]|nr:hypothetical protein LY76DRAFT_597617 [Colletotrichum caudatum]